MVLYLILEPLPGYVGWCMGNYMPTLAELPMGAFILESSSALKYFWHLAKSQCCYVLRCSEPPESQSTDHRITLDSGGISICLLMGIHIFYVLPLKFYELGGSHFKITTALRYGHLNSYQSEQPHYSKVCLLSQNKIYWPSEGVKNIDLSWFWLYRVVWRRRLQKIVFKMGQRVVKTHYHSQD